MKPRDEVVTGSEGDVAMEMECEMQARDFFFHIGMLILEGRTPQHSDKGRVEGPHCLSLFSMVPHVCDPSVMDYGCQKACERKEKMTVLWQNSSPMVITVMTQFPDDKNWILLERWTVDAVDGIDVPGCNGSMLMQAVRSHIHFSQLSAWLSISKGAIPSQIIYRLCAMEEDSTSNSFLKEPDFHTFPLANLHSNRVLRVSVQSLPRCDIFNFTDKILSSKLNQLLPGPNCNNKENEDLECVDESARSPLKKKSCVKQLDANHDVQTLNGKNCSNKQNILEFSKPSTSRTLDEQVETRNCERNLLNATKTSQDNIKDEVLKIRSLSEEACGNTIHGQTNQQFGKQYQSTSTNEVMKQSVSECKKSAELSQPPSSKILIRHGVLQGLRGCHVGNGTLPIFNSRTGLPVSSSPAPLRRSATDLDIEDNREVTNGIPSEKSSSRDLTAILSKSAPASTTQSLLGNFEESVLNGRMEPLGTVEGFTVELGASGSFCPAHVTLPVKAYFFSLSDDNAPSPYLGYISLNNPSISRKGYHVPTKGTVQLTLFNPNKTVVKMFVVLYDFSDMPPKAQTFLRQRTFSVWNQACHSDEGLNSLHYLIHLRFVSSKSGRLYLHTDIRVIFARQPPDLPSGVTFCTVTDGPTEPRYTLS